jgi:hypothetical protein
MDVGCVWWLFVVARDPDDKQRDVTHHIMKIIDDGVMKFKILCSTESLVSFSFFFPSFSYMYVYANNASYFLCGLVAMWQILFRTSV